MIRAGRPVGTVLRLIRFAQTAEDLMTPDPVAVPLDASLRETASLLTARGLAAAPVVNDGGQPVGSVSRLDIARLAGRTAGRIPSASDFFDVDDLVSWSSTDRLTAIVPDVPARVAVREVMDRRIHRVRWDASAAKVVEELLAKRVQRLFVVDDDGVLIGTVGALDVLRDLRR